jgi:hypothetical protein
MKLRKHQRVNIEFARERALQYLDAERQKLRFYCNAASVAGAIWPDNDMKAQGAGAAASRVLKALEKDGMAIWGSSERGGVKIWGWQITAAGLAAVRQGETR